MIQFLRHSFVFIDRILWLCCLWHKCSVQVNVSQLARVRLGATSRALQPQQCVAADWHELIIPQPTMRSSIVPLTDIWTRCAAFRHTIAPVIRNRPYATLGKLLISVALRVGGWVGLSNLLKPCSWASNLRRVSCTSKTPRLERCSGSMTYRNKTSSLKATSSHWPKQSTSLSINHSGDC